MILKVYWKNGEYTKFYGMGSLDINPRITTIHPAKDYHSPILYELNTEDIIKIESVDR